MVNRNTHIPTNQIEYLERHLHLGRSSFRETFYAQFNKELGMKTNSRSAYLWDKQDYFLKELERTRNKNHTVLVPVRVVNKAIPGEMRKPAGMGDRADIDELLSKQNNLLAEIVVLLKEQIGISRGLLANHGMMIENQRATLKLFNDAKRMAE
jgi:hypothetical protein